MVTLAAACLGAGCASSPGRVEQQTFASPDQAVTALVAALRANDRQVLMSIFGPDSAEIVSSGDPVADAHQREVLVAAVDQKWLLLDKGANQKELVIGDEDWPCPIPLVQDGARWRFDGEAGIREVLARRIGRNELDVIALFHAYVRAQNEYASQSHDGQPAGTFAQKFKSDDGKHNGLYWSIEPGQPASPLGALVSKAQAEGYNRPGLEPFHGYRFKALSSQGPAAPGGARSFVENGRMTGGFGLLAYPAEYGNSGVMTFMVGKDGVVLEADLGEATEAAAAKISAYNPDPRWKPAG